MYGISDVIWTSYEVCNGISDVMWTSYDVCNGISHVIWTVCVFEPVMTYELVM